MILVLRNGYPFPYPTGLSDAEEDKYANGAAGVTMTIHGVESLEWLHQLTVKFESVAAANAAIHLTDWDVYDDDNWILTLNTSAEDGYQHPAIVVRGTAYCGFYLGG